MPATLSIRGLYLADNTLFSEMSICSDMTLDDKQTIIDNILMEFAELEVIYPDPVFMKHAIGAWSWKEVPTWDRIYTAAMAEYNPIENYNRTETSSEKVKGSRTEQGSGSETNSGTDSTAHSGTDRSSTSNTHTNTGTDTDTNSGTDTVNTNKYAYDTNTMVPTGSDSTVHGHMLTKSINETETDTGSASVTHGETVNMTHGHKINTTDNRTESNNNDITRTSHIAGNIGVTTSQQMLEQEILVAPKLNVYNYIMESFKNRFCLEVW